MTCRGQTLWGGCPGGGGPVLIFFPLCLRRAPRMPWGSLLIRCPRLDQCGPTETRPVPCLGTAVKRNCGWPGGGESPEPGGLRRAGVREADCQAPACLSASFGQAAASVCTSLPAILLCSVSVNEVFPGALGSG